MWEHGEMGGIEAAILQPGTKNMANQYLGTPVTAFLVLTILAWAAVAVSGTSQELSTTTGDTVNIPCLFGEGTLSSIFWAYNDGTGRHKILSHANWDLTIEPKYAGRASLQKDNSTLILKDITVADAGTYRCDVDRQGQTVVTNINTNLNVFSLRPDTLPVISPCTVADESSSCSIHANQSFTLTCTLLNVYPVEVTKLIWYQDGQRVFITADVNMQNDDGTTDISKQIRVCETGNFTCNATYVSANGRENTVRSVEAWIIPLSDVPNTPGKNMTSGEIFCKTMNILLIVMIIFLILNIALLLYCLKARGQRSSKKETNKSDGTQLCQEETSILFETSAEIGSKDGNEETSILLETSAEIGSKDGNVEYSTSPEPFTVRNCFVNRSDPVTPSSLAILECFITSGLHPSGDRRVVWPKQTTVVCLINYSYNSEDIVIKSNTPQLKHAEEILIEYINRKLDITKIKRITIYSNYSSCTQCSGKLQKLKKEIPDLQIKFSALLYIRRPSCAISNCCRTDDPISFTMLRKLDARPFQKEDWDNLIDLLKRSDEQKGYPPLDLRVLRYGDHYRIWRNEEDEKMMADYAAMTRRNGEDEKMMADYAAMTRRNEEDEETMADYAAMTRRNGEDENIITNYEMKSQ